MNLELFFNNVAKRLELGNRTSNVVGISGGLMHKMYRMDTEKKTYAIKLLNSNIMKRPDAIGNYAKADRLEYILQEHNIPILPALKFGGEKMQEIEGQYLYVYEWYEGSVLNYPNITKLHCNKISKALACIHQIEVKEEPYPRNEMNINWDNYVEYSKENNRLLYELLRANKALLYECQNNGNQALSKIPPVATICHNDMDCKNVLWRDKEFKIIDLECLGYSNPYLELFELALCWSGYEHGKLDVTLFTTFMIEYFADKPKKDIDWKAIYACNNSRLEWLEYNIKRALLLECDTLEEQELGMEQVTKTMAQILYYNNIRDKIFSFLRT